MNSDPFNSSSADSILLFAQTPESPSFSQAHGVELMMLNSKEKLSGKEEINALKCVFENMEYEKALTVTFRLCGACSVRLQGDDAICKHCRCKTCKEWKVSCRCGPGLRWENNRAVHSWMRRGFIQHSKQQDQRITSHCVICQAPLSRLTAPFLRCVTCIGRTI